MVSSRPALSSPSSSQTVRGAGPSKITTAASKEISVASFYGAPKLAKPTAERIVIGEKSNKQRLEWGGALHNPKAEGAVVMQRPDEQEAKRR